MYIDLDKEEQSAIIFLFETENNRADLSHIASYFDWSVNEATKYLNELISLEFVERRKFRKNEPEMFSLTAKGREYIYDHELD
jgi:predicted transcriptional regulator